MRGVEGPGQSGEGRGERGHCCRLEGAEGGEEPGFRRDWGLGDTVTQGGVGPEGLGPAGH